MDVVLVVVGPAFTALVAGIGVLIREWRSERRWEERHRLVLERGLQEVAFIAQWSQAHAGLSDADPERDVRVARAIADLERTYRSVGEKLRAAQDRPERAGLASLGRSFLLGGVRRPGARVVRVLYYAGLAWLVFSSVIMLIVDSEIGFGYQILVAVFMTLLYAVPVWGLHRLARWLDRPAGALVAGVPALVVAPRPAG